jgi:hypothetical protein
MPQLIRPNDVRVVTKDGEVKISISLDLNINLNQSNMEVKMDDFSLSEKKSNSSSIEDKTIWQIPDFSSSEKIDFGK